MRRNTPFYRRALMFALLAGLSLAAGWRFLCKGIAIGVDHTLVMAPWLSMKWNGGPPLFDPYTLSGVPLYNNLQAALLYPLRWPFFFLKDWRDGYPLYCFVHVLIAITGAYVLARAWRISRSGSLLAAILFGCGGYLAGRPINPVILFSSAWLPWLLLGASGGRSLHRWATTIAFAMILAIGSPHLYIYGAIGYAIIALSLRRFCIRRLVWQAFHLLIGAALVAPALIPGLQAVGGSVRAGGSILENLADSVPLEKSAQVFLGGTGGDIYPEFIDHSCFIGSAAALIVALALLQKKRWRDPRFRTAAALSGIGFVLALGKYIGMEHVLPWLPGLKWLTGPNRSLVLTAVGLSLMAGLALDRIARRQSRWLSGIAAGLGLIAIGKSILTAERFIASSSEAPSLGLWLQTWLVAPAAVDLRLFPWLDGGIGLFAASAAFLFFQHKPRLARTALTLIAALQCLHFASRVEPPMRPKSFYDPPPNIRFLMARSELDPAPFRVFGYDPLRIHNNDVDNRFIFQFLVPQVSALFGLEDVQGFDPLIPARYADLIEQTAGRSPINDKLRNLDLARPDPKLLNLLGVRYLIGHPYEQRVSNLPLSVSGQQPIAEVQPTEPWPTTPVTDYLFVSLFDGSINVPIGTPIARLHIEAAEGAFDFQVRNGIETAHTNAANLPGLIRSPEFRAVANSEWSVSQPLPQFGYSLKMANFRGRISFARPLTIKSARWESLAPPLVFFVSSQTCRVAPPKKDDPWRLAFGAPDDIAPVYEFLPAADRAVFIPDMEDLPTIEKFPAHSPAGVRIEWKVRSPASATISVSGGGLGWLAMRQYPENGWRADLDGRPVSIWPTSGRFMVLRLGGDRTATFTFRPASKYLVLPALAVLAIGAILLSGRVRKRAPK